eukprot:7367851-Prymnesium_polylepis.1
MRWASARANPRSPDEVERVPLDGDECEEVHRQRDEREGDVAPEHVERLGGEVVEAEEADDRAELHVRQRDDQIKHHLSTARREPRGVRPQGRGRTERPG